MPPSFLRSEPSLLLYVRHSRISSARMRSGSRPLTSGRSKVKTKTTEGIKYNVKLCSNKAQLTCVGNTTCEKTAVINR